MEQDYAVIGWREWVALPELGIRIMKAKIDTGARTSALHASSIRICKKTNKLTFTVYPDLKQPNKSVDCIADLIDQRWIMDSGGHKEQRYTIQTLLVLGERSHLIEITLTSRSNMRFKLLLGRSALLGLMIDPHASYLYRKKNKTL